MRRGVVLKAVVVAFMASACGSGGSGSGGSAAPSSTVPAATSATVVGSGQPGGPPKAAARWETVSTFTGTNAEETPEFQILPTAIQWRVRWTCETGRLRITSLPPPRRPAPLVDDACPKEGTGFSILSGGVRLVVEATGGWKAVVDQQVDTPIEEPLLPGMAGAPVQVEGGFYPVEKEGKGTARIVRLPDGRRVLRLEGFEVSQNTDLFVWLSEAVQPRTSAAAVGAERVEIGNLKSTVGSQNYEIPGDLPTERIRSIVIWCQPVQIAYTAAALSA